MSDVISLLLLLLLLLLLFNQLRFTFKLGWASIHTITTIKLWVSICKMLHIDGGLQPIFSRYNTRALRILHTKIDQKVYPASFFRTETLYKNNRIIHSLLRHHDFTLVHDSTTTTTTTTTVWLFIITWLLPTRHTLGILKCTCKAQKFT